MDEQMRQVIIDNISQFFYMYAERGSQIAVAVFFVGLLFGIRYLSKKRQKFFVLVALKNAVFLGLLAMYVYIVIGITMLSRSESYTSAINLRLFSTFSDSFTDRMYIYENVLLFMPLAILLFFLGKIFRKWWVAVGIGILGSLAIEMGQLITHLGRFEVDDILTNTVGMFCSFLVCKIIYELGRWLFRE